MLKTVDDRTSITGILNTKIIYLLLGLGEGAHGLSQLLLLRVGVVHYINNILYQLLSHPNPRYKSPTPRLKF